MAAPHPHADPRLEQLLLRWDELRDRGQELTPEELCRDCPELLPGFRDLLRARTGASPGPSRPPPAADLGRWRRPALAAAAVLGAGLAVALVLALKPAQAPRPPNPLADEERRWAELDARLRAGHGMQFIGDAGPPAVWRWGLGPADATATDAPAAPFAVSAPQICLVE